MSDEPSFSRPSWRPWWWARPGRRDPEDSDILRYLAGRIDPIHPIGPLSLRFRTRRLYILVAVAVTALLLGAGAALVFADSGTPVAAANTSAPGPAPSASGHQPGPRPATTPDILHGQYVVRAPAGGYETIYEQTGQVIAVSSTSITLRSIDGFTQRYLVGKSTVVDSGHDRISSVKVGDQASLRATASGSMATASTINDLTILQHRSSTLAIVRGTPGSVAGAGPA